MEHGKRGVPSPLRDVEGCDDLTGSLSLGVTQSTPTHLANLTTSPSNVKPSFEGMKSGVRLQEDRQQLHDPS